ncbi:MAG: hypothetical protein LBB58_05330 [Cellulomonadaceae bacterium]|jgi:hypothetical protein|nr:hypothetical protein [Cellulomonadaceae bacterium]
MGANLRDWTLEYAKPVMRTGLEQLIDSVTPGLPTRLATDQNAHDEHIAALGLAVNEAEEMLADAVLAARTSGRTWTQIADALGIDRAAAQARFSGNAGTITQIGASLVAPSPNNSANAAEQPGARIGPMLGEVRRIQPFKWGKATDLNLVGSYGWHITAVELNQNWTGGVATAVLDDQRWEYAVTSRKRRQPPGGGWELIDGPGVIMGAIHWGRPTGQAVSPGNPEPKVLLGMG